MSDERIVEEYDDGKIVKVKICPESFDFEVEGGTWILDKSGIRFRWDDGEEVMVVANRREDESDVD